MQVLKCTVSSLTAVLSIYYLRAMYTPKPTAPMAAIVMRSTPCSLIHVSKWKRGRPG